MESKSRRRFLKGAAAAGVLGSGTLSATAQSVQPALPLDLSAYGQRSRFERSARSGYDYGRPRRPDLLTPLQDSVGILTPSGLHYEVSHGSTPPDIDPSQYSLSIAGLVNQRLILSLDAIKRRPSFSRIFFLECAGNTTPHLMRNAQSVQVSHGFTSCSEWTGVPLSSLLNEAGLQSGAKYVIAEGTEPARHTRSFTLEKGLEDVLVAYGQNGEALRPENGYPLRLLVPGYAGFYSVKWLRQIRVSDQPHKDPGGTYQHDDESGFVFDLGPKSVITSPAGGARLPGSGFYTITGLAWSGKAAIRRVEVSTDGGKIWRRAELQEPRLPVAHARFNLGWEWTGGEAVLQSRCIDELGQVQPTLREFARSRGITSDHILATGQHGGGHFNAVQPWRVTREGRVQNGLRRSA